MNLEEIRKEKLNELNFEIYKKNISNISNLPIIKAECKFDDVIEISADIDDNTKNLVYETALSLKPWRKGPFDIFQTFIDSEWQSFIKFNILKPFLNLQGKVVGDIGCNNGYYLFRMLNYNPAKLVGFDPGIRAYLQFKFINHFINSNIHFELLGVEHLPYYEHKFDTLFCLGVLYHRSDPIKCLKDLKLSLNPNGELFLDTMIINSDKEIALCPNKTYSKIPNIYFIPSIKALQNWCQRAKFKDFTILATKKTDENEQRKTSWIDGESLGNFLNNKDKNFTVEGYPAPLRAYIKLSI
ncbi:tRNA 5-methoxyuridine(34)/uridine 5-oxyacetic acid(34) synthase CmoB [Campylobacter sputorum]|uniref:tRNA 5-methoxyuridine(34)/uridine 5-oxyacetic acid(34) synthase CmoB n=1 Tax=Campylobacter sputorum TaxID=206 RepID=UPI000B77A1B3|nr:tRNA 5-methoxyuridine(34)/uridine 5-oxyacetic acid(34) synthase CmoB [Campylobacter sputorum]ASM36696.1 tRNA (cmo5U34)-carboxymethyltransferase [Campylobacter sputorum bv. faecalis CCUG 20703]